jgi:hypothetical protein
MKVPAKYTEKFNQVVQEHPNAYSVEYVDSVPGGVGYAPYAQVTTYSDEQGAAANRQYIPLS